MPSPPTARLAVTRRLYVVNMGDQTREEGEHQYARQHVQVGQLQEIPGQFAELGRVERDDENFNAPNSILQVELPFGLLRRLAVAKDAMQRVDRLWDPLRFMR